MPAVSVLIGCFNNAGTLRAAIDSILAQTVAELELIVVDDGSTDATAEVARSTGDERVRHLGLPHLGIARSLNEGLRAARAPIVAVQDADDWSEPARLERQLALLAERPAVAVVGCRMREVGPDGAELVPRTTFRAGDVGAALLHFNPIPNSCATFRRDAVLELGGYDPRWRFAAEHDLWLRVAERHVVYALDEVLATRSMSGANVAARAERAQTAETLLIRAAALRRRRTLRGASGLIPPAVSWLTPPALKRARRRRLGQAP